MFGKKKKDELPKGFGDTLDFVKKQDANSLEGKAKKMSDKDYAKLVNASNLAKEDVLRKLAALKQLFFNHPSTCNDFIDPLNKTMNVLKESSNAVPAQLLIPIDSFISSYIDQIQSSINQNSYFSIDAYMDELKQIINDRSNSLVLPSYFSLEYVRAKKTLLVTRARTEYYRQLRNDKAKKFNQLKAKGKTLADDDYYQSDMIVSHMNEIKEEVQNLDSLIANSELNSKTCQNMMNEIRMSQDNKQFMDTAQVDLFELNSKIDKVLEENKRFTTLRDDQLAEYRRKKAEQSSTNGSLIIDPMPSTSTKRKEKASKVFDDMTL